MSLKRIGIIGGTGLYEIEGFKNIERVHIKTPFGEPSDELVIGEMEGRSVVFLPRHGSGHRFLPSEINYRANIWALKSVGVEWIISISAVGSLKEEIKPLDIVLVDQFVDRTYARKSTFFGNSIVAHIMFAHPVCENLRKIIFQAYTKKIENTNVHWGGTYLNMEGPAFSTKAESNIYRSLGIDVIGMTNLTEAKLAREAEICYATLAMVTDYDCWIENDPESMVNVEMIMKNLNINTENAKKIVRDTIIKIPENRSCECKDALKTAIITQREKIESETIKKLAPIIGKYINDDAIIV
jgi:5'-methylthioadenosine phosphorylase